MLDTNGKLLVNGISNEWFLDRAHVADSVYGIRFVVFNTLNFVDSILIPIK